MRFPLQLPVDFDWTARDERVTGAGATVEIGSDTVLFACGENPPPAALMTASVDWPACLEDGCRLRLFLYGTVVAARDCVFEMTVEQYEFRTARRERALNLPRLTERISAQAV